MPEMEVYWKKIGPGVTQEGAGKAEAEYAVDRERIYDRSQVRPGGEF